MESVHFLPTHCEASADECRLKASQRRKPENFQKLFQRTRRAFVLIHKIFLTNTSTVSTQNIFHDVESSGHQRHRVMKNNSLTR